MRALLSVYDKRGIVDFARALTELGWEIISTGGTLPRWKRLAFPLSASPRSRALRKCWMAGSRRSIQPSMVGFSQGETFPIISPSSRRTASRPLISWRRISIRLRKRSPSGISDIDAIEQIDIGGPAMVRAAAKNFAGVIVVTDPNDYETVLTGLRGEGIEPDRRRVFAAKAFAHVSAYDSLVAAYLRNEQSTTPVFPNEWSVAGRKLEELRYGENPQQRGASYTRLSVNADIGVLDAKQLAGKALSYNNLLDADAAWGAIQRLPGPAVSIVKHTIPCGLAHRETLADAFDAALAGDPVSAFGGIVALSQEVDAETARRISKIFFEVVIAPGFSPEAIDVLGKKKQLRLLEMDAASHGVQPARRLDIRPIRGGLLLQDADDQPDDPAAWEVVTSRKPTEVRISGSRVRLGSRSPRQIECDCAGERDGDHWRRKWPAKPGRERAYRRQASRRSGQGQRSRRRRLFPLSGWS